MHHLSNDTWAVEETWGGRHISRTRIFYFPTSQASLYHSHSPPLHKQKERRYQRTIFAEIWIFILTPMVSAGSLKAYFTDNSVIVVIVVAQGGKDILYVHRYRVHPHIKQCLLISIFNPLVNGFAALCRYVVTKAVFYQAKSRRLKAITIIPAMRPPMAIWCSPYASAVGNNSSRDM